MDRGVKVAAVRRWADLMTLGRCMTPQFLSLWMGAGPRPLDRSKAGAESC